MQTFTECIPCFQRQVQRLAAMAAEGDTHMQKHLQAECQEIIEQTDTSHPPPELAARIYARAANICGRNDFFAQHKHKANTQVLHLLPKLQERVQSSLDPLLTALRFALIANYIDAGVEEDFDWESALTQEVAQEEISGYAELRRVLDAGQAQVMILGDNAGEIGMDTLLVKQLQGLGADVIYAVRGTAILNDATLEDAEIVGMDRLCRVVSSGVDSPGTIPSRCNEEFLAQLYDSPIIISKGQGNFESLHGRLPGVFFAFKVKCPVVARITGFPVRTSVFAQLGQ